MSLSGEGRSSVAVCLHRSSAPLKRPGEEGSARCSLLEFLQKWPIFGICQNLTPKKGDTSRDPKTRVRLDLSHEEENVVVFPGRVRCRGAAFRRR